MCIENTSHQLCFIYGGLVMYDEFAKWLDRILDENMPYEWQQGVGWEKILDISCEMIRKYLTEGKYAEELKKYEAVAAGFVDGDVEILYRR